MRTIILLLALALMPLIQIKAAGNETSETLDATARAVYVIGRITPNNPILTTSVYPPNNTAFSIRVQNEGTTNQVMLDYNLVCYSSNISLSGSVYTSSEVDTIQVNEGKNCSNNIWYVTIKVHEGYAYQFNSINVILEY